MSAFSVPGDLDVSSADTIAKGLRDWVSELSPSIEAQLDVSHEAPTQVALQLLFAAFHAARSNDCTVVLGPFAEALVDQAATETEVPAT